MVVSGSVRNGFFSMTQLTARPSTQIYGPSLALGWCSPKYQRLAYASIQAAMSFSVTIRFSSHQNNSRSSMALKSLSSLDQVSSLNLVLFQNSVLVYHLLRLRNLLQMACS